MTTLQVSWYSNCKGRGEGGGGGGERGGRGGGRWAICKGAEPKTKVESGIENKTKCLAVFCGVPPVYSMKILLIALKRDPGMHAHPCDV